MRIKGLFWILTSLLLVVLAVMTYYVFYNYSSTLFFCGGRADIHNNSLSDPFLSPYY